MRQANSPMTRQGFERVLGQAIDGWEVTDTGATFEVHEALSEILDYGPSPARIKAARAAFAATDEGE